MRFHAQIEDDNGEVQIECGSYVSQILPDGSCESVEMELYSMLRAFRNQEIKRNILEEQEAMERLEDIKNDLVV